MSQSIGQPKLSWFQRSERWQMFTASPLVVTSAIWLALVVLVAIFAPALVAEKANLQDLLSRFYAPFQFGKGWEFVLGADSLGRPILLQLALGAQTSMIIAFFAVGTRLA